MSTSTSVVLTAATRGPGGALLRAGQAQHTIGNGQLLTFPCSEDAPS